MKKKGAEGKKEWRTVGEREKYVMGRVVKEGKERKGRESRAEGGID